jgi:hypothetical protein
VDTAGGGGGGKAVESSDVVKLFDAFVGPRTREDVGGSGSGSGDVGGGGGGSGNLEEQARAYDTQMRRALERQADELNWMQRFGSGSD